MSAPDRAARLAALIAADADPSDQPRPTAEIPTWTALAAVGSRLWLDTGDLAAAGTLWCPAFSGLTTNNTLLNKEVQTGAYDGFIPKVAALLGDLDERERILEIAFALNARHGLRLVRRFACQVSVELHTDLADDAPRSIAYGLRYHAICPERFIVKLPFTAAGLIAARELARRSVTINFTLGFSARHNHLAAVFARPAFVNVFLGRLNAYVIDNKLGDGNLVGEKALLASQRAIAGTGSRQIAASLRSPQQVRDIAGVDVYTMPTAVAEGAAKLPAQWTSRRDEDYAVSFAADPAVLRSDVLWAVTPRERAFAAALAMDPPATAFELIARAHAAGCGDIFPRLDEADRARIAADGKIPKHAAWSARVTQGELGIDTLLNLAGLASFTADQAALDARIRRFAAK